MSRWWPGAQLRRSCTDVGVLQEVERLKDAAGAEIEREHRLGAQPPTPAREFVQPNLIRLQRIPRQIEPLRPLTPRANPVLPPIAGHEVATWITDGGHAQLAHQAHHVRTEPIPIR
jgi:hypothetical protein